MLASSEYFAGWEIVEKTKPIADRDGLLVLQVEKIETILRYQIISIHIRVEVVCKSLNEKDWHEATWKVVEAIQCGYKDGLGISLRFVGPIREEGGFGKGYVYYTAKYFGRA